MKKALSYLGWMLFSITFILLIYFVWPKSSTCDVRGYIEDIQIDEQNHCAWVTITEVTNRDSHMKLKVTEKTSVQNLDGSTISIDQTQIGKMLDGDIKDDKVAHTYYEAERVKIYQ